MESCNARLIEIILSLVAVYSVAAVSITQPMNLAKCILLTVILNRAWKLVLYRSRIVRNEAAVVNFDAHDACITHTIATLHIITILLMA